MGMLALWIRAMLQLCFKRFLSHPSVSRALDGRMGAGEEGAPGGCVGTCDVSSVVRGLSLVIILSDVRILVARWKAHLCSASKMNSKYRTVFTGLNELNGVRICSASVPLRAQNKRSEERVVLSPPVPVNSFLLRNPMSQSTSWTHT